MNEVEKMYENAGLSNMWVERYNDGHYEHERYYDSYKKMINNMMKVNDWTLSEAQEVAKRECKKEHPPFTAEKQIELIKLLGSLKDYTVEIDKFKGVYYVGCREAGSNNKHWGSHNLLEEALAELVNDLWQDLTEEEKQQVKGILE